MLTFLDGEIGEALQYILRRNNVTFRLNEAVAGVTSKKGEAVTQARVRQDDPDSQTVLYATGRQGATESAGASTRPGLEADKRGRIKVDEVLPHDREAHLRCRRRGRRRRARRDRDGAGPPGRPDRFEQEMTSMPDLVPTGVYAIPEIGMVGPYRGGPDRGRHPLRVRHRALLPSSPAG